MKCTGGSIKHLEKRGVQKKKHGKPRHRGVTRIIRNVVQPPWPVWMYVYITTQSSTAEEKACCLLHNIWTRLWNSGRTLSGHMRLKLNSFEAAIHNMVGWQITPKSPWQQWSLEVGASRRRTVFQHPGSMNGKNVQT